MHRENGRPYGKSIKSTTRNSPFHRTSLTNRLRHTRDSKIPSESTELQLPGHSRAIVPPYLFDYSILCTLFISQSSNGHTGGCKQALRSWTAQPDFGSHNSNPTGSSETQRSIDRSSVGPIIIIQSLLATTTIAVLQIYNNSISS